MKEFSECDWYACPNGHVYLIGECRYDHLLPSLYKKDIPLISTTTFDRLPMTMAKCAACGAKIGGKSHMMLKSNEQ